MYRWVEHTSEVELEIEGNSLEAVFEQAALALGDLLGGSEEGRPETHEVSASADDLGALLVAWMDELLYLADTHGFIPRRIDRLELREVDLTAVVGGERTEPQTLVKAVTYHRLEVMPTDSGWRARVVLDV